MMITQLAAAALASMAMVQQIDTTFAVASDSRLDVYNHEGTVTVTTWNRNEIRVRARWDEGRRPISIRTSSSGTRVRVEPRDSMRRRVYIAPLGLWLWPEPPLVHHERPRRPLARCVR